MHFTLTYFAIFHFWQRQWVWYYIFFPHSTVRAVILKCLSLCRLQKNSRNSLHLASSPFLDVPSLDSSVVTSLISSTNCWVLVRCIDLGIELPQFPRIDITSAWVSPKRHWESLFTLGMSGMSWYVHNQSEASIRTFSCYHFYWGNDSCWWPWRACHPESAKSSVRGVVMSVKSNARIRFQSWDAFRSRGTLGSSSIS